MNTCIRTTMILAFIGLREARRPYCWAHLNVRELKFSDLPWGVNLTPLPLVSNFHNNFTDLIGLSFLCIETKELCEARAKLVMSSHFQIYPGGGKSDPLPQYQTSTTTLQI